MLRHPYRGRIDPVSRSHASVQGFAGLSVDRQGARAGRPRGRSSYRRASCRRARALRPCRRESRAASSLGIAEDGTRPATALQAASPNPRGATTWRCRGPNAEASPSPASGLCATFEPRAQESDGFVVDTNHTKAHRRRLQSGGIELLCYSIAAIPRASRSATSSAPATACLELLDIVEHLSSEGSADVSWCSSRRSATRAPPPRRREGARGGKPIVVAKIGERIGPRRRGLAPAALAGAGASYRAMSAATASSRAPTRRDPRHRGRVHVLRKRLPTAGAWASPRPRAAPAAGWPTPAPRPDCRFQSSSPRRASASTRTCPSAPRRTRSTAPQAIRTIGLPELARLVSLSERVDAVIAVVTARSAEVFQRGAKASAASHARPASRS